MRLHWIPSTLWFGSRTGRMSHGAGATLRRTSRAIFTVRDTALHIISVRLGRRSRTTKLRRGFSRRLRRLVGLRSGQAERMT